MLTVMMATFNGEHTLPVVLEAYRELECPDGGWCIVIIDNGSTDSTPKILDRYSSRLPLTRLSVPDPGKNKALNAGLIERKGDLIVFTDDDAVPASDWLCQLRAAVDENTEYDLFGGTIRPRWESYPDKWILEWVPKGVTYAIHDEVQADGPVSARLLWGPNMAVRSRVFDAGHIFDPDIGPTRTAGYAMGSETDFNARMEAAGYAAWFVKDAAVEHIIRKRQVQRSWIMSRARRWGRGLFHQQRRKGINIRKVVFGIPRYQIRKLAGGVMRLMVAKIKGDAESAFWELWNLHTNWGFVCEFRHRQRRHDQCGRS